MKKFTKSINENKKIDLSYKDFFGRYISHESALKNRISGLLSHIIMDENKISEKYFKGVQESINYANSLINDDVMKRAQLYLDEGRRLKLLVEEIYDKSDKKEIK